MTKRWCGSVILAAMAMGGIYAAGAFGQAAANAPRADGSDKRSDPAGPAPAPAPAAVAQTSNRASLLPAIGGGSLVRGDLGQSAEGATPTISSISLYTVPDPKPKLIRKHDLITIVVREDSNFSSVGDTNLQHQSDLDAKITSFIKLQLHPLGTLSGVIPTNPLEVAGSGQRDFKSQATV